MKRFLAAGAALAAASLLLSACGGGSASTDKALAKDGTFSFALPFDPGNLHPLLSSGSPPAMVDAFVYDSLIDFDPVSGKAEPWLATEWTESPTEVTFTVRDGVTCSDGTAFTAQTVAGNLNFVLDPKNGSPWLGALVPADATVSVSGDVVSLKAASPTSFMLLNIGQLGQVCEAALKNPDDFKSKSNGTGLFTITDVAANDHVTMTRREGYHWAADGKTTSATLGVPKTVVARVITNTTTAANLLLSGELNAATVSGPDQERVRSQNLKAYPAAQLSGVIYFNHHEKQPTSAPAVRKAMVQAIDLDALTKLSTAGEGTRAISGEPSGPRACTFNSVKGAFPSLDPAAAAATLDADGWVKDASGLRSKDGVPLNAKLIYNNAEDAVAAGAEYLAKQWKAIGIKVKLVGGDISFVRSATFAAEDPSAWTATLGMNLQTNTPSGIVPVFSGEIPPDGVNFASMNNAEYEAAAVAANAASGEATCDAWEKAERTQFGATDFVPFAQSSVNIYFNGAMSTGNQTLGAFPGATFRVFE